MRHSAVEQLRWWKITVVFFGCFSHHFGVAACGANCLGRCPFWVSAILFYFFYFLFSLYTACSFVLTWEGLYVCDLSHCLVSLYLNRQSHHHSQEPGLRQPERHLRQTGERPGEAMDERFYLLFTREFLNFFVFSFWKKYSTECYLRG